MSIKEGGVRQQTEEQVARLLETNNTAPEGGNKVRFNTCSWRIWKDCFTGKLMSRAMTWIEI